MSFVQIMKRCKRVVYSFCEPWILNFSMTYVSGSPDSGSSPSSKGLSARALVGTKEKPVFTLKQMTIICERMCKERTDKVREEYDQILQQKLSEQYDAFVKFIDHQVGQALVL